LLYPLSLRMFGVASGRVLEGGFWAYLTDPIFLMEPLLVALAAAHWIAGRRTAPRTKRLALFGLVSGLAAFTAVFLWLLPTPQRIAVAQGVG